MTELSALNQGRTGWLGWLSLRDRLAFTSVAVLGIFFGVVERDWYVGTMAALSLGVVLGLAAQVHDLWRSFRGNQRLTSEQCWGWRFAVIWRLVVMCLIVAHFLVRVLVTWKVFALEQGDNVASLFYLGGVHDAVLLTAIIVAIADSPRFAKRTERRWWLWAGEILAGIGACILWAIILRDQLLVPALVHITIAGIEMAQPHQFSSESLAAYDAKRLAGFIDVTTVGFVSVVVSCVLLRLFALACWRGMMWRAASAMLLAVSLATTIVLSARIIMVEVPGISPALAADIHMPQWHQIAAAAALALLLVSAVARRWSEPPPAICALASLVWRRDDGRYYHERYVILVPLAVVMLVSLVIGGKGMCGTYYWFSGVFGDLAMLGYCVAGLIESPILCLSIALTILAVRSIFSKSSTYANAVQTDPPPLAPGLFLLVWLALLTIIVFGVPILGAWGFALGFNVL